MKVTELNYLATTPFLPIETQGAHNGKGGNANYVIRSGRP